MDSFEKQDLEIYSMWMGEKKGNREMTRRGPCFWL